MELLNAPVEKSKPTFALLVISSSQFEVVSPIRICSASDVCKMLHLQPNSPFSFW